MEENPVMGRPSLYNKQTCDLICARLAMGESLRAICKDAAMPNASTVTRWLLDKDKKDFCTQYTQARCVQNQLLADELIDLSNPPETDNMVIINRNRLQIDTRKWWLSKVMPKEYGDKVEAGDTQVAEAPDLSALTPDEKYHWLKLKRKMNGK